MVKKFWWREIQRKWSRTEPEVPHGRFFSEPRWQNHVALWYLVYRWLILVTWTVIIVCSVLEIGSDVPEGNRHKWLIYLTNWDLTLGATQALLGVVLVSRRWKLQLRPDFDASSLNLGKTEKIYWFFYIVTSTLAISVTVSYWAAVYDPKIHHRDPLNFMIHVCNSVLMIIDGVIVAVPFRLRYFWWCLTIVIFYLVFSIVYYAAGGLDKRGYHYIYKVLDWEKTGQSLLVCLGGLTFLIGVHCFLCFLVSMRNRLHTSITTREKGRTPSVETKPPFIAGQNELII